MLADIPEEERQEKLSIGKAEKLLAKPKLVQQRRVTSKHDVSKYNFDDF